MKTLISSALIVTALVAGAPASAQQITPGIEGAANHFNQDFDTQDNRILVQVGWRHNKARVSTRGNNLSAQERFNQDFDGQDNVRVTRSNRGNNFNRGQRRTAAQIFADIRRQNAEDE